MPPIADVEWRVRRWWAAAAVAVIGAGCAGAADDAAQAAVPATTTVRVVDPAPATASITATTVRVVDPVAATASIVTATNPPATSLPATTTSSSSTTTTTPPSPRSFTMVATGDILTEQLVLDAGAAGAAAGERYDFAPLFAPIAPIVEGADLAICHMELPIGGPGERSGVYGKSPNGGNLLLAPFEIAPAVVATGFDRCSTASNHSNDLGVAGIDVTLSVLDAVGLGHAGTARSAEEAVSQVFTVGGIEVAHLAYTRYSNTATVPEWWRISTAGDVAEVAADVLAARAAGAEVVIISLHIAKEMLSSPTGYDRSFVTELTATVPIDVIVEHGPHVIQPMETVNGTVVFWSVGNLLSGMGVPGTGKYEDRRTLDGLLASVRFTEVTPGEVPSHFVAEAHPVLVCNERRTRTVYAPITALADPELPADLRTQLTECVDRAGRVVADLR